MSRSQIYRRALPLVFGLTCSVVSVGACADERDAFDPQDRTFDLDASSADAPSCLVECSLDGRSIIDTCTGAVVETCRPELACGGAKCQEPCAAAAADRSSNGCEFYFQMPRMTKKYPHSCEAAFIVNTSTQPVTLSLVRDGRPIDISSSLFRAEVGSSTLAPLLGPIPAGESALLFVSDSPPQSGLPLDYIACPSEVTPATTVDTVPERTGIGSSFLLTASVPIALTSMYPFGGAPSIVPTATLVLPVATWAKEHMIVNGWAASRTGDPSVQIVAAEDDTEVSILPKADIEDGARVVGTLANNKATYRLAKGEHLQIVQSAELTGSLVTSSKPTTLFGGNSCARIPGTASACDVLSQQIPALEQWGAEYVGVGYRPRLGNEHEPVYYRIVAARDGTRLDYDPAIPPGAPTTMNAGEVVQFSQGTGDAFVVRTQDSEHPIYVSAHMTGGAGNDTNVGAPGSAQSFFGWGDPEFVNVVPAAQYLSSYSFYADHSYPETSLVVVRRSSGGEFKDVWLECAGNLPSWKPVGTRGQYEFTRVDLARRGGPGDSFGEGGDTRVCRTGLQRMRSEGPFTATVWGWAQYASYAYPGGFAQRKLVEMPFAPIN